MPGSNAKTYSVINSWNFNEEFDLSLGFRDLLYRAEVSGKIIHRSVAMAALSGIKHFRVI